LFTFRLLAVPWEQICSIQTPNYRTQERHHFGALRRHLAIGDSVHCCAFGAKSVNRMSKMKLTKLFTLRLSSALPTVFLLGEYCSLSRTAKKWYSIGSQLPENCLLFLCGIVSQSTAFVSLSTQSTLIVMAQSQVTLDSCYHSDGVICCLLDYSVQCCQADPVSR